MQRCIAIEDGTSHQVEYSFVAWTQKKREENLTLKPKHQHTCNRKKQIISSKWSIKNDFTRWHDDLFPLFNVGVLDVFVSIFVSFYAQKNSTTEIFFISVKKYSRKIKYLFKFRLTLLEYAFEMKIFLPAFNFSFTCILQVKIDPLPKFSIEL